MFATHRRTIRQEGEPCAWLLYMRGGRAWASALWIDGPPPQLRSTQVDEVEADFLSRLVVCAPVAIGAPGNLCFGEIAGALASTGRASPPARPGACR